MLNEFGDYLQKFNPRVNVTNMFQSENPINHNIKTDIVPT